MPPPSSSDRFPRRPPPAPDPDDAATTATTAKPTTPAPIIAAEIGCCFTVSTAFELASFTPSAVRSRMPLWLCRRPLPWERDCPEPCERRDAADAPEAEEALSLP